MHEKNDDWTFLRKGPQATDKEITLEDLKRYDSRHRDEALKLLADWKSKQPT